MRRRMMLAWTTLLAVLTTAPNPASADLGATRGGEFVAGHVRLALARPEVQRRALRLTNPATHDIFPKKTQREAWTALYRPGDAWKSGFTLMGTINQSGTTPPLLKAPPKMLPGDVIRLERAKTKDDFLVLVYLGEEAFNISPAKGKSQAKYSFFGYPYPTRMEYNTFPPRIHKTFLQEFHPEFTNFRYARDAPRKTDWLTSAIPAGSQLSPLWKRFRLSTYLRQTGKTVSYRGVWMRPRPDVFRGEPGIYPGNDEFLAARTGFHTNRPPGTTPKRIVLHVTSGNPVTKDAAAAAISWFRNADNKGKTSAHFVIARNGRVTQMVNTNQKAHHAGSANSDSIGIELAGRWGTGTPGNWNAQKHSLKRNGSKYAVLKSGVKNEWVWEGDQLTKEQTLALTKLMRWCMAEYGIGKEAVTLHRRITTKACPAYVFGGEYFVMDVDGSFTFTSAKALTAKQIETKAPSWFAHRASPKELKAQLINKKSNTWAVTAYFHVKVSSDAAFRRWLDSHFP